MEEYKSIIELKNSQAVCTYLGFLQSTISRMGENSLNIKALISVIYTVFVTILIAIKELNKFWWLGLVIVLLGIIMDAYYLALERMYRTKYDSFLKRLNNGDIDEQAIFNMNFKSTNLKYELFGVMLETLTSFSVIGFYILFVIVNFLLKLI